MEYAEQLVKAGHAYYAFDTAEELEIQRKEKPNFLYGQATRMSMRNSLTLAEEEVKKLLDEGTPYVIRINIPSEETVVFTDMIRGEVRFETNLVDDKVLLKADGMPTYHLAVVVDDHAMEISHAFRGEEWLPSAPIHILLWKYLGWQEEMPQWAHLPLILKPDGNGKLSKRDGDRLGFPVYAMNWMDPKTGILTKGFREMGFLPEAFVNMLAMLGWNDGTDRELFSLQELCDAFSIERISKAGAKFDFEKAKWYNHEWILRTPSVKLLEQVSVSLHNEGIESNEELLLKVIDLVKERCNTIDDFLKQSAFFFVSPKEYDLLAVKGKWDSTKTNFFNTFSGKIQPAANSAELELLFKQLAEEMQIKPGELMLPLRIMLVGGKFGPGVFDIAALIGTDIIKERINTFIGAIEN
ncbi:MAG: glutamate--tRNA ligase [Sphingobacteriales bacterium]|nr:MAG: glutamate--tRNA ligase [Sphingobacteriales bacterium]